MDVTCSRLVPVPPSVDASELAHHEGNTLSGIGENHNTILILFKNRGHPFSTYAKFIEKLTFLTR